MSRMPSGEEIEKERLRRILNREVVLAAPGVPIPELARFVIEGGAVPPGVEVTTRAEFLARGRVADCDCELVQCACLEIRRHSKACPRHRALISPFSLPCDDHGMEVCVICDPCSCGGSP